MRAPPLIEVLRTSTRDELQADVSAGITTAVMLVPQGMAYATLAGLDPIVGLYASTLPLALYAFFGSSRPLAVGPVAMDSLMVAAGLLPLVSGDASTYATHAAVLALMVGAVQMGMGALRVGFLVRFLAQPVVVGFTAAAAVIIGMSQLKSVVGVPLQRSQQAMVILFEAFQRIDEFHVLTMALSIGTVATLVVLKKKAPHLPRFLLVVVAGTLMTWALGLNGHGVDVVGAVPSGLPGLSVPRVPFARVIELVPIAVAIAIIAMMEAISVSKRYDDTVVPNQELFSLGLANLGAGIVGGYPVTGGFSRTAVNAQAGARSPFAGLVTSSVVVLTLVFLTRTFYFLPNAVLASIILTAVVGLVDLETLAHLRKEHPLDFYVAVTTFIATLGGGIQIGMAIGVASSMAAMMWRSSKTTLLDMSPSSHELVVTVDGPLFFGNIETVEHHLSGLEQGRSLERVVIDAPGVGQLDSDVHGFLARLSARYRTEGVEFEVRRSRPRDRAVSGTST